MWKFTGVTEKMDGHIHDATGNAEFQDAVEVFEAKMIEEDPIEVNDDDNDSADSVENNRIGDVSNT